MSQDTEPTDMARSTAGRRWAPIVVATVGAATLVVGVVAVGVMLDRRVGEEQPSTSTSASRSPDSPADESVSEATPTVPVVVDGRLYVDGAGVPGEWWSVQARGAVWVAQQRSGSWWWGGPGVDPGPIEAELGQPPVVSPRGGYVAFVDLSSGRPQLSGFDTRPAGEGFGLAPAGLPTTEGGVAIRVRAVTDDGEVVVQGRRTSLVWRPLLPGQASVVDLSTTAPGWQVLSGTTAGLVVVDGMDADPQSTAPRLADLSSDGRLTITGDLPTYDDLAISPGGAWLVRSPAATLGGEVTSVETLRAQPVRGGDEVTLHAPPGSGFAAGTWSWEDDRSMVAVLLSDDATAAPGLVRCDVRLGACRALVPPTAATSASTRAPTTPEATVDAVLAAAAASDRASLPAPDVIGEREWDQLVGYVDHQGGAAVGCRANGGGTRDCELRLDADPTHIHYAILAQRPDGQGWRITYVGIADG